MNPYKSLSIPINGSFPMAMLNNQRVGYLSYQPRHVQVAVKNRWIFSWSKTMAGWTYSIAMRLVGTKERTDGRDATMPAT